MRRHVSWPIVGLATWACVSSPARAHESRPLYVEVTEEAPLSFTVRWKAPSSIGPQNQPEVSLGEGCVLASEAKLPRSAGGALRRYRCDADPAGTALHVDYPAFNPAVSTLIRVSRLSGQKHSLVAPPDRTEVILPASETLGAVGRDYLRLGVEHILHGYDHLLFLICLLLIAGTARRILITITGFTIAHSMTLALSALGVLRVPVPPVEAAIALSIVFLAVEIVRGDQSSLTYRYPIAVASSFGLLHGFGFAAVLGEAGLPQTEVLGALLFFNLGVELGQILFVAGATALYLLVRLAGRASLGRDLAIDALGQLRKPAAYVAGIGASFWMVQRIATFWAG